MTADDAASEPALPPLTIATTLRPDGISGVSPTSVGFADISRAGHADHAGDAVLLGAATDAAGVRGAGRPPAPQHHGKHVLVSLLARGVPVPGAPSSPRRPGRVRRARPGPSLRAGGAARASRSSPTRRDGRALPHPQADEFADKEEIRRDGAVYRWIRQADREVIPQVDGLVYVSEWARDALTEWFPEADAVPSVVVGALVTPLEEPPVREPVGDLVTIANLDIVKNHRFLLAVLAEAKRRGREYSLDVYGEGPLHDDLVKQTLALGLDSQVTFHGFRTDARRYLPGIGRTCTPATRSRSAWRSSRAWRQLSRSWSARSARYRSSVTTGSRAATGP